MTIFHQKTTFITGQLSSKDKFHHRTTFIKRQISSKDNFRLLQKTTFILTHQSHIIPVSRSHLQVISQVSKSYPHSLASYQSSLLKISSLTRVTSVKSLKGLLSNQSHINKVYRRHLHSPESYQSSLEDILTHKGHTNYANSNVQSQLSSLDNFNPHLPKSHQSSLWKAC